LRHASCRRRFLARSLFRKRHHATDEPLSSEKLALPHKSARHAAASSSTNSPSDVGDEPWLRNTPIRVTTWAATEPSGGCRANSRRHNRSKPVDIHAPATGTTSCGHACSRWTT
jgi:hypothetical protein